jgi:hypothetical protein
MNIRVRRTAVAVLALTLSLNAASLFAAPRERNFREGRLTFIEQIIRRVKQVLKPVTLDDNQNDGSPYPGPPKP